MRDLEVMTFRRNILSVCQQAVDERNSDGPMGQARYIYPPDIHSDATLPPHILSKVEGGAAAYTRVVSSQNIENIVK